MGNHAASDCTHTSWDRAAYEVTCSDPTFGRPHNSGCQLATLDVVAKAGDLYENREFLGVGVPPYERDDMPIEQTPQTFTSSE